MKFLSNIDSIIIEFGQENINARGFWLVFAFVLTETLLEFF
jgi:hypothetical protein